MEPLVGTSAPADREDCLFPDSAVAGQPLTASYKSFVVFRRDRPDVVLKGPYPPASARIRTLMLRTAALRAWGVDNVAFPLGVEEFARVFPGAVRRPCVAVTFPNLLGRFPAASRPYTDKAGRSYPVAADPALRKLNQLLPARLDLLTPALLRTLTLFYILGVGDVGLANVVVTRDLQLNAAGEDVDLSTSDRVTVIDYEETATKDYEFYTTRPPGAKTGAVARFRTFYAEVAADIRALDLSVVPPELGLGTLFLESRRAKILGVFERDSCVPFTFVRGVAPLKIAAAPPVAQVSAPPKSSAVVAPPVVQEIANDKPETSALVTQNRQENIGRMNYAGLRGGSTTRQGLGVALAKSALQKHVRRGNAEQAIACALELRAFLAVGGEPVVHNMYNRLAVIACEDLSPRDLSLPAAICAWVDGEVRGRYDAAELAAAVEALALAPKSRIMSHFWRAFTVPEAYAAYRARRPDLGLPATFADVLRDPPPLVSETPRYLRPSDYTLVGGRLCAAAVAIREFLARRDPLAIVWIKHFLDTFASKESPLHVPRVESRRRRTRPDVVLWEILAEFVAAEYLDPLTRSYFAATESRVFLVFPVVGVLLGAEPGCSFAARRAALEARGDGWRSTSNLAEELARLERGDVPIAIAPYMNDMHVVGRIRGCEVAQRRQFVLEGAFVENQDPDALDADLKAVYEI